ncbi:MAG: glycosyltransferase, partial [Bacteroidia bacterium]|nr:glycosyltransferase [Bacteroidia bacterium]
TFDNPWKGNIKQVVGTILAPLYFSKIFSHCWVPGKTQKEYALRLGFDEDKVFEGMYSADVDRFKSFYDKYRAVKENSFPKRILFVGRYTDHKGVTQMWEAFQDFQKKHPNDWELWCIGKGELDHMFPKHEKIKNFGFVQPEDMDHYIQNTGVFILPSKFEHWGVVVHEYAASGFPIISSDQTAAASTFLRDNYNGFMHKANDKKSLEQAFEKLLSTSDEELIEMGKRSLELSESITPSKWSAKIWSIIKEQ